MKVNLSEYFQLIKVIRMLYGVQVAQDYFEHTYKAFGFTFNVDDHIIVLPRDIIDEER